MASEDKMIWGALLHFGYNMWSDIPDERPDKKVPEWCKTFPYTAKHMRFDYGLWKDVTARMAAGGLNTLVVDVGEGLRFPSHPELAVSDSRSAERVAAEVARLKALGLEVVPKLNFSTSHDAWLGEYQRMVGTETYYRVCRDVIRDTYEAFGHPRLFHLGYDEESVRLQQPYDLVIVRQGETWWHDFNFFVKEVERLGMRAWIWSDFVWEHEQEFLARMPKSVLQSNWYYHDEFDLEKLAQKKPWGEHHRRSVRAYELLEKAGFDQVPCMSNYAAARGEKQNIPNTVAHCSRVIAPERLKGFLVAPWARTQETHRERLEAAVDLTAAEIAKFRR